MRDGLRLLFKVACQRCEQSDACEERRMAGQGGDLQAGLRSIGELATVVESLNRCFGLTASSWTKSVAFSVCCADFNSLCFSGSLPKKKAM